MEVAESVLDQRINDQPSTASQLLRDRLELIALDDVAHLIFVEVAELDAALETDAHFFHVVLETAQRGEAAIVNRLAPSQHPRARGARDPAIGDEAAGDNAAGSA